MTEHYLPLRPATDLETLLVRFESLTDTPAWALTDTRNRVESTVRRRWHLIFIAAVKMNQPHQSVADAFGVSKWSVWNAVKHHTAEIETVADWAVECRRIEHNLGLVAA